MPLIKNAVLPVLIALLMLPIVTQAQAQSRECTDSVNDVLQFHGENDKAIAVELIVQYIAVIDERDLRNSSGTRLTDYRAILQQDRANLHRTGRADRFDEIVEEFDDYFTTLDRRKLLSTAPYYFNCWMSSTTIASLMNDIESGQVAGVIWVVVFRHPDGSLAITISLVG